MRWIVQYSLKFRFVMLALAMGLMFFGARQLDDMPVDVFPEFAPPRVEVQTISIGLSPDEVEADGNRHEFCLRPAAARRPG